MPKIDILEWSKSVLNHFESVRGPSKLSLSFGVVRLSRKLFRKYGQARSHQKTELLLRETQVKVDFGETEISQLPARICSFESYL